MGKNVGKNISKSLRCKYPQKRFNSTKKLEVTKYATELLKLIQKEQVKKDQEQLAI